MSIALKLPEELERELSAEAARLELSLAAYVLRLLATAPALASQPETGAELVDYWQSEGLIGTRFDITDSPPHARRIRDRAERRLG